MSEAHARPTARHDPCRVPGVDLLEGAVFESGREHDAFDALRVADPVSWHPLEGGDGFWALVRHDDLVAVNRDWETFGIHDGSTIGERGGFLGIGPDTLSLAADPPVHTQMRLIVNRAFTRRAVEMLEGYVHEEITGLLDSAVDRFGPRHELDFATEIAHPLPLGVMGRMIGIPPEDRAALGEWTATLDGSAAEHDGEREAANLGAAGAAIFEYANRLAEARAREPRDDMVSRLLTAEVDGRRLDSFEFALFFLLLLTAGTETTRAASALGTLALLEHPRQRAALAAGTVPLPAAIEELLRFASPIVYFRRTARRDVVLRGRDIMEGDQVVMWFAAANRDPEVFTDPHRLDLGRSPNPHVAFGGGGPHFCLGAHVARLVLRVLVAEMVARFPDIELAGPAARKASNFMAGLRSLPVRLGEDRAARR